MSRGMWSVVLGAALLAIGCGNSEKNAAGPGDSDAPPEGGAPGDPGEGGTATAGRDSVTAGKAGSGGRSGAGGAGAAPSECATPECGGDVVGTWEIIESCVGSLMGAENCPGLAGDASGLNQTGATTYNEDLTYTATSSTSGVIELTFPLSCIAPSDCDTLALALESSVQSGFAGASCRAEGDACVCDVALDRATDESGTYTVQGNSLLLRRSGAPTATRVDYCVNGDTLTVSSAVSQSYVLERR